MHYYRDRVDAGKKLVPHLMRYALQPNTLVLALPRGGVPVASVVANALQLPLDILLVRKLGVLGHEELAMGALAQGGIQVLNTDIIDQLQITPPAIAQVVAKEQVELAQRNQRYREGRPSPALQGKAILLIDDGAATGASLCAALRALGKLKVAQRIAVIPVAPSDTLARLQQEADAVICPYVPSPFMAIGRFYQSFEQTPDHEVVSLLSQHLLSNRPSAY